MLNIYTFFHEFPPRSCVLGGTTTILSSVSGRNNGVLKEAHVKGDDIVTSESGRRGNGTPPHTRSQTSSSGLSHGSFKASSEARWRAPNPPGSPPCRPSCVGRGRPRIRGARGLCSDRAGVSYELPSGSESDRCWTF